MGSSFKRPLVHDEAFITSLVRYGEADCIVRLFLREQGKLVAFFKGGLATKKNRVAIQAPALARIAYLPPGEEKMARLCSCDLDPKSFLWASSLRLFAYGNYLAELIEKLLPEEEPAPAIFNLLEEALQAFLERGANPFILRAFELKVLENLGYLPEMPALDSADIFYDPIACHFGNEEKAHSFKLSSQAIFYAQTMLNSPLSKIENVDSPILVEIGRIFFSRLSLMGMLPLKSTAFFKEL